MKQLIRISSTLIALSMLIAVFGAGSVLAGRVDTSRLGQQDPSDAPRAVVTIAEDKAVWASQAGQTVSFTKADTVGTFFIQDGALQTTGSDSGVWDSASAMAANTDVFRLNDGFLNITGGGFLTDPNGGATYTLGAALAAGYDTTTPTNTPLTVNPSVTVEGVGGVTIAGADLDLGTFRLAFPTQINAKITAAFDYHIRDRFDTTATTLKRARVYSTSDPQGEVVQIVEVEGADKTTDGTDGTAVGHMTAADGMSVTVTNLPIVDRDGDGDVDADDVTVATSTAIASSAIKSVNFDTGVITFNSAMATESVAATTTYKFANAKSNSNIYRGQILLSSDPGAQGTSASGTANDGVWVQDGDTVTIEYLQDDGVTVIHSDTITVDTVKPTISNIQPADGTITNSKTPFVQFDVTDTGSKMPAAQLSGANRVKIYIPENAANPVEGVTPAPIADGFRTIFSSAANWDTAFGVDVAGTKFSWRIVAEDVAGNINELKGTDLELTIDTRALGVTGGRTGVSWDTAGKKETTDVKTSIKVTFNKELDADSVQPADFTVGGIAPSAVTIGNDGAGKFAAYLTVSTLGADDRPEIKLVAEVKDKAGNSLETGTVNPTDGLTPAITAATISHNLTVVDDKVKITVDVDEKLASTDGIILSVQGAAGSEKLLTISSPTPLQREGTFTVGAAGTTDTGLYGVSIRIKDLGGSTTNNLTKVSDEVPTVSTDKLTLTLKTGPIGDWNFDGVITGADISALTDDGVDIKGNITTTDASARTLTLTAAVAGAVKVTYYYVKDHTFEVDHTAPGAVFDPADKGSINTQSPFIRVTFDDKHYPGDNFDKVTLTKAELIKPDGTTEDVLVNFVTADNKEYIWAASNLALGEYTLKVSGKDEAANEAEDKTATFTIEKRTVTVNLRPGWNLVSLPDDPEDGAINTVVTSADIDVVLSYDPTTPHKWLNATRGDDGLFTGTLKTIKASRAYWVHTRSFDPIKTDIGGLQAGQAGLPPSFNLVAGWNMVPVSTSDLSMTDRVADDYFSTVDWSRAYGYDNATNAFMGILPGETDLAGAKLTVKVGQGYWLFLRKAGTLVP